MIAGLYWKDSPLICKSNHQSIKASGARVRLALGNAGLILREQLDEKRGEGMQTPLPDLLKNN